MRQADQVNKTQVSVEIKTKKCEGQKAHAFVMQANKEFQFTTIWVNINTCKYLLMLEI